MKVLFLLFCLGAVTDVVMSIRPMRVMMTKKIIVRPSSNISIDSDFAVRFFYQQLIQSSSSNNVNAAVVDTRANDKNILFSPISIVTTLMALSEGANGTTVNQIYQALNSNPRAQSTVRSKMAQTLNFLNKVNQNYVLSVANRIFVEKGYHLLPKFEDVLKNYYKMNVERLNFELGEEAEKRINDWVSDETRRQITSIIPPGTVDTMTRMVLTNGIYFKGDWQTMFDEKSTDVMPFHVSKERHVRVPFMFVESSFPYYNFERLGFEMLELPYTGGEVSMFIVLPYSTQSLLTVARRLKSRPFLLSHHLKRLNSKINVSVVLPKFKFSHSLDLKSALTALGVSDVFEQGKADLSKIAGNDELHVSDAFHKAAVEVSERGTTASAASAMVIRGRSMSTDPLVRADRPFIFFIRHNPSSSILFMGAITDFPDDKST